MAISTKTRPAGVTAVFGAVGVVIALLIMRAGPWTADALAPFVKADVSWSAADFDAFLMHASSEQLGALEGSLKLAPTSVQPADRIAENKRAVLQ